MRKNRFFPWGFWMLPVDRTQSCQVGAWAQAGILLKVYYILTTCDRSFSIFNMEGIQSARTLFEAKMQQ